VTLTLQNRISGCLLAGALGDSIGAHFETETSPQFLLPTHLRVTDDTQLTIATCESIVTRSHVDPESVAARMADWYRDRRISGIGSSTLKALTELDAGGHWAMVGATGERSAGNGAAMRISPLAFFLDPNTASDRTTIRDVCRITHRNDEAYLGALAILYAINHGELDRDLLELLVGKLPDSCVRDRFIKIRDGTLTSAELASQHCPTGYVVDSVPLAILVAIESNELMDSIKSIVEFGGDTDTIASMFGNIFGAIHGSSVLPMDTVKQIDEYNLISQTASNLFTAAST